MKGGNNALGCMHLLFDEVKTVGEALHKMEAMTSKFQEAYKEMLDEVTEKHLPTTTCTIFNPDFPDLTKQHLATTALFFFNGVIMQESSKLGIPVIDYNIIMNKPEDYATSVEPSVLGGDKLTDNIIKVVEEHDFKIKRTVIYAGTN
ncbi:unnamed protein product [Didymodactylos carnosus]|uniref:Uncharacterized protein n=1 Tax=Didymodactylos carnosus TaxID=1234261 RepID=A0A814VVL6_9BILA|nr:unnamed protein product [Didymodactylos carnosus]CAF1288323.1 unnamed protein product [Didymodactylos carnosus]CAF3954795.1 unnamed protein product [Didymodactylos carnosus]CAF4093228.1 unnamed protein product [Didymodactylos carnosus]